MFTNTITNVLLGCIVVLLILLGYTYTSLNTKLSREQNSFLSYKEQVLKDQVAALESSREAIRLLQEEHSKEVEKLKSEKDKITSLYNTNKRSLDSLHSTLEANKASLYTAPSSRAIEYTNTLSDLLGKCTNLLTDIAARADEATAASVSYHNRLIDQKRIVDDFNKQSNE